MGKTPLVLDGIIALAVLVTAYKSSWRGTTATVLSLFGVACAAASARYLSRPITRWLITGIEWPYNYSIGLSFLIVFGLALLVMSFILGPTIQRAEQGTDGTTFDRFVAAIVGGTRGLVLMYCIACGLILCSQRWGSQRAYLAIQYQNSPSGRWMMTHNLISPEAYPHAYVIRGVLGYEDGINPRSEAALLQLRTHPMTKFMHADSALKSNIWNNNWKVLRRHTALLSLTTSPEFLQYADVVTTPDHKKRIEKPASRYKELK